MSAIAFVAMPTSSEQIEAAADRAREHFGMADRPYADVLAILEQILPRALGDTFEFGVLTELDLGPIPGCCLSDPNYKGIYLRSDIYDGLCEGDGYARFTACHELGHLLLHSNRTLFRQDINQSIPRYQDPEWQADRFAAAFLMPAKRMRGCGNLGEVRTQFGVSAQAAKVRAEQLNLHRMIPSDPRRGTNSKRADQTALIRSL